MKKKNTQILQSSTIIKTSKKYFLADLSKKKSGLEQLLIILDEKKTIYKKKGKIKIKSIILLTLLRKIENSEFSLNNVFRKEIPYNYEKKDYSIGKTIGSILNILESDSLPIEYITFTLNFSFTNLKKYIFFIKNNILFNLLLDFNIYFNSKQAIHDLECNKYSESNLKKSYYFYGIKKKDYPLFNIRFFFSTQNDKAFTALTKKKIIITPEQYNDISKQIYEFSYKSYITRGSKPSTKTINEEMQKNYISNESCQKYLYGHKSLTKGLFKNPETENQNEFEISACGTRLDLTACYSYFLDYEKNKETHMQILNFIPFSTLPHYTLIENQNLKQLVKLFIPENSEKKLLIFLDQLSDVCFFNSSCEKKNGVLVVALLPIKAITELLNMGCVILQIFSIELYVKNNLKINNYTNYYKVNNYQYLLKNLDLDLQLEFKQTTELLKLFLNLGYGLNFRNIFVNHLNKLKIDFIQKHFKYDFFYYKPNIKWQINGDFFFPKCLNIFIHKEKKIRLLDFLLQHLSKHKIMFKKKFVNNKKLVGYTINWEMIFEKDVDQINYVHLFISLKKSFVYLTKKFKDALAQKLKDTWNINVNESENNYIVFEMLWNRLQENITRSFNFPHWIPNFHQTVQLLENNTLEVLSLSNQIQKSGNFVYGNIQTDNIICNFNHKKSYFLSKNSKLKKIMINQEKSINDKNYKNLIYIKQPGQFRAENFLALITNEDTLEEEWKLKAKKTISQNYKGLPVLPLLDKIELKKKQSLKKNTITIAELYKKIKKNEEKFIQGKWNLNLQEEKLLSSIKLLKLISQISLLKKK